MDRYLKDEQQQKLKDMLYGYLSDKAQRRAGVTSKNKYEGAEENFANQMEQKDTGTIATALSSMASMAGTLGGKRSQDTIVPRASDDFYKSTQGAYENFRTLRDSEERSNMNDLNVARYVSDLERADDTNDLQLRDRDFRDQQYKDLDPRRKLEQQLMQKKLDAQAPLPKARWQKGLQGPGGRPVVMDEYGRETEMPTGFKEVADESETNYPVIPGYEGPDGSPVVRTPKGARPLPMGPGIKKTPKDEKAKEDKGSKETAYRYNALMGNIGELKKFVDKYGTFELAGSAGESMDSLIYDIAIDYAKVVDPESVAREGEVNAAKKYMLPIRNMGGLAMSNKSAKEMINNYVNGLNRRVKARQDAYGNEMVDIPDPTSPPSEKKDLSQYPKVKNGKILVIDRQSGQPGYVFPDRADPKKYEMVR